MMNKTKTPTGQKSIFKLIIKAILSVFIFILSIEPDEYYLKRKAKEKKEQEIRDRMRNQRR